VIEKEVPRIFWESFFSTKEERLSGVEKREAQKRVSLTGKWGERSVREEQIKIKATYGRRKKKTRGTRVNNKQRGRGSLIITVSSLQSASYLITREGKYKKNLG